MATIYQIKCPVCGREFVVTREDDKQYLTGVIFVD